MYFPNSKLYVIYSAKYRHTFIQGIQRTTALRQGCPLLPPARNTEWITSFHSPHCTNSPAAFPQARSEERREQTRTAYCPRCPNTGRNPALLLQPVADVPPTLTRAGLQPRYFSRTVSIKWSGNHGLLGTAWWNPAAHAPQQAHCHHFAGLGLKSTCCLRAAGVKMPARTADTAPRKHCRSSLFCQHISWLIIFVWAPKTHSWLYVKQHAPHSNSKI